MRRSYTAISNMADNVKVQRLGGCGDDGGIFRGGGSVSVNRGSGEGGGDTFPHQQN